MDERLRIAERERAVAEQERTLRALEIEKKLGRAPVSEERVDEMRHVADTGRQQVKELKEVYEVYSLPEYEIRLEEIQEEVAILKEAFTTAALRGLTAAKLHMLHDGLDGAESRIQELDTHTPDAVQSRRRRALVNAIEDLRRAYPLDSLATATSAQLSHARTLHYDVRAAYANAEHRLGLDDRRRFKSRIAQLAARVRQAEHHHWMRLIRMAHAEKVAPEIAEAITLT